MYSPRTSTPTREGHVQSKLSARALEQIHDEIVLRKGRTIQFLYLTVFFVWATLGIVIGSVLVPAASYGASQLTGYGWVLMGPITGVWMSVAAIRREIAFEDMPNFLDSVLSRLRSPSCSGCRFVHHQCEHAAPTRS